MKFSILSHPLRAILALSIIIHFGSNLASQNFVIKSYDIDIHVIGNQAQFDITETITVDFLIPRRGIIRNIPFAFMTDGEEKYFDIKNIKVSGEEYKVSSSNRQKVIRIGNPNVTLTGLHTYIISYTVEDAFVFAEDHTEFYWNLIGGQWKTNIEKVSYEISLDEALPMTPRDYVVYTGTINKPDSSTTIEYYLGTFKGISTRNLQPGEGITVAINLPIDYVKRPSKYEILWQKYGFAGIAGFLLTLISGFFYNVWRKYGKDVPIIKAVRYTPPKELNPSEVGVLIDERADNIDIIALLPYWAHQGLIHIKRIPKSWGKDDHQLIKIKELPTEAHPFEKIIFEGLFQGGNMVSISDLKESFYEYMSSAKTSLKSHLNTMGVYYPVSMKMQTTAALIAGGLVILAIFSFIIFHSFWLSGAFALSATIGFIFSYFMLKKNELGIRLYQDIIGFKMFVKAAEKDKIERMLKDDPDYFEKTLPYAMVFGYAKQWSKKFDGLLLEPPKWYLGPHGGMYYGSSVFNPGEFGDTFSNDIQEIQQVFTSTPAPSGGGGFSGGGSVGGGFGGGGGDSW
ncbi:MAG: DUF2207 domain-containing protein [Saprospiraceae bacterium]